MVTLSFALTSGLLGAMTISTVTVQVIATVCSSLYPPKPKQVQIMYKNY